MWSLILLMGCSSEPVDSSQPTDTSSEDHSWPRSDFSLAFAGQSNGITFAEGTLEVTIQEDGTERVSGRSVIQWGPLEMRADEVAILDVDGLVITWDQSTYYEIGGAEIRYHHELDAAAKTVTSVVQDVGYTTSWEEDGAAVMEMLQTDLYYGFDLPSPVTGHVLARAMQSDAELIGIYPSWRAVSPWADVDLDPCMPMPSATYCYELDGRLLSYDTRQPGFTDTVAVRTDYANIQGVSAITATSTAGPDSFDIPDEGARHEVLSLSSADGTAIVGRVLLPEGSGPFPVVVIVPASPGLDRTGTAYQDPMWDGLAEDLLASGVAVASFDARGTGESGGIYGEAFAAQGEDAAVLVASISDRSDLDTVVLLGHGALSAVALGGLDAAGTILVDAHSGSGAQALIDDTVNYNLPFGWVSQEYDDLADNAAASLTALQDGSYVSGHFDSLPVADWWLPYLETDGTAAVLETPGPVMLLNPEFGGSSAADDHAALGDALAKAGRAVTQVELEGLGFYLQPAVAQELGLEYPLPVGPDPLVAASIVDFIADLEAR